MSQSIRRTYESRQVISNRNISSSGNISSQVISAESQMRSGKIRTKMGSTQHIFWQPGHGSLVYRDGSDYQQVFEYRKTLEQLIRQFQGFDLRTMEPSKIEDFKRRLLLLQNTIDSLFKTRLMVSLYDEKSGERKLDYMNLINEKQNQIIELEKKIQNLQERLRRKDGRELQLQNQIAFLNSTINKKNEIIEQKEKALTDQINFSREMASIVDSIRVSLSRNNMTSILNNLVIPSLDITEIRASAKRAMDSRVGQNDAIKLIREFESAGSRQGSKFSAEAVVEGWIMGLPKDHPLKVKFVEGQRRIAQQQRYADMQQKFSLAAQIYAQQLQKIKAQNPGIIIDADKQIFQILGGSSSSAMRVGDVITIQKQVSKTIQVPVQDARTKHLIFMLASHYKKMFAKYPKLYNEIDPRLAEFFSQQLIDYMQVDELDRVVEVVKYVPQVVKVENVYAYSSEKSRKIEFHLRVLVKALLEELEKIRRKTGVVLEMDEGMIGMIRQEIMDVVEVDDILKVFRVTPKIVEVEKIVEKIVETIVEVPKIIEVERVVQTPVEVKKYEVVQNTINVPIQVPRFETLIVEKLIQVPRIEEKIVEVPKIIQKVVEVLKQVPKVVEVQKRVEKVVEVMVPHQIIKQVIVPTIEYRDIEIIKEVIVPVKETVEVLVPVDRIIEKIVQVPREIIQMVQVQKIVQKLIIQKEYITVDNPIPQPYREQVPVQIIKEKIVPIQKIVQRIVEVPQTIQKIVVVRDIVQVEKPVEVVVEKPVYIDRIKEVQKIVEVPVFKEVIKEKIIEKIVQVPLIQEVVRVQREIVEKPVIQVVERIVHKEVQIQKPKILYQDRIKEVEKIINHFVNQPQIITIIEEKIIPIEKIIERIRSVPTIVQKYVQKLVEVPKVVEVEKIVQKIVVVPRIVEKIVQIPQIIEKIVQKIETINQIIEVEKIVNIPVIQERIVEVQVPRNVYIQVEKPVDVVRQVMVRDEIYKQNTKFEQLVEQKIVVQNRQIPRTLEIQKIVTNIVQQPKIIEITKDIIVPVQIEVPVDRIIEKVVPLTKIVNEVKQVDKVYEKIVAIKEEETVVKAVEQIIQVPITKEKIINKIVEVPLIQKQHVPVDVIKEKVVPIRQVIHEIRQIEKVVQKVVDRVIQIQKAIPVEHVVEKRVDIPKIIEVQKIVPEIIKVNKYIETIVEKIVEIPVIMQQLRQIQVEREKIISIRSQNTTIKQVDRQIQKQVLVEKLKQVTNNIHLIENTLQIVDRIIEQKLDPVLITQERVVEIPQIIQKIVEKVVVMPQIVQVLKYVYEVAQKEGLGVAVGAEIGIQEVNYKNKAGSLKSQLQLILVQLRKLKSSNPTIKIQIQLLQKFLAEFQNFILFPRIHQIITKEEVKVNVEKQRPILIPVEGGNREIQIAKSLILEQMISELRRVKKDYRDFRPKYLDEQVSMVFLNEVEQARRQKLVGQLQEFSRSVQKKFALMGGWSTDHQHMLNTFLQERFFMANILKDANRTIKGKTQEVSKLKEQLNRLVNEKEVVNQLLRMRSKNKQMTEALKKVYDFVPRIITMVGTEPRDKVNTQIQIILKMVTSAMAQTSSKGQLTHRLDELTLDARTKSLIRQKDDLIIELRNKLTSLPKIQSNVQLQRQLKSIMMEKSRLQSLHSKCQEQKRRYTVEIEQLRATIRKLQIQMKRLTITSPKESINTNVTITSPKYERKIQNRAQTSRKSQKSQTDSEGYGRSYQNYRNYEQVSAYDVGQNNTYTSTYQIETNGVKKHLMSGSEVKSVGLGGGFTSTAIGGKINSQNYIAGGQEFRSNGQIETGSYNRMQMSAVSGNSSPRNVLSSNGKKYEMYYETKYEQ